MLLAVLEGGSLSTAAFGFPCNMQCQIISSLAEQMCTCCIQYPKMVWQLKLTIPSPYLFLWSDQTKLKNVRIFNIKNIESIPLNNIYKTRYLTPLRNKFITINNLVFNIFHFISSDSMTAQARTSRAMEWQQLLLVAGLARHGAKQLTQPVLEA